MREIILTALVIMSVIFSNVCAAESYTPYLNDNKNVPLTWTYQNDAEYARLDTCKVIRNDKDSYEISIEYIYCYSGEGYGGTNYEIRFFRQKKDGVSLPQYSDDNGKTWITIPSWKDKEAVAKLQDTHQGGHYPEFAFKYNPRAYYLFCAAYKKAFGKDYIDI